MIQVTLTNGRETSVLFYEMEIPQAMKQALIDRPGFWMKDVKTVTNYIIAKGVESFYDDYQPSRCDRHHAMNEEIRKTFGPWASY